MTEKHQREVSLRSPTITRQSTVFLYDFILFELTNADRVRPIFQVKKIHENEKRLQAGPHSLDLLAHDFEKNYNMYIYPVHWQFGQLDQHPVDGYVQERRDAGFLSNQTQTRWVS